MRPALRLAFVAAAFALATPGVRAETRDACTPDATRLCPGAIGNVATTTACLVAHKAQLSATCRGVFAFAEPVADLAPPAPAAVARTHPARPSLARRHVARAHAARVYRRVRIARPYHIPRFDQAEAEAEVHTQYRYRTPYLPYWVFP